ncbi:MAG TPA: translation elongation factor Ts [Patescibacteria group bacterium]|nr:translation elongation factor Ts [Patescibacteria group bacterium]
MGIADCKAALEESGGDIDGAVTLLRERGQMKAAKKSDRAASEGMIATYVHANGKIGAMVQLNCETDFVARNEAFVAFAKDLAMHVASENPLYMKPEDVPSDVLEKEREIYREQLTSEGKPSEMIEKILPGKLSKFFEETCLMEQLFIKDDEKKIKDLVSDTVLKLGENIQIADFKRFAL